MAKKDQEGEQELTTGEQPLWFETPEKKEADLAQKENDASPQTVEREVKRPAFEISEPIDVDAEDNDDDGIVLADSSLVADVMEACND